MITASPPRPTSPGYDVTLPGAGDRLTLDDVNPSSPPPAYTVLDVGPRPPAPAPPPTTQTTPTTPEHTRRPLSTSGNCPNRSSLRSYWACQLMYRVRLKNIPPRKCDFSVMRQDYCAKFYVLAWNPSVYDFIDFSNIAL